MRVYRRLGEVPAKRHVRWERDGRPVYEELVGRHGFSGPSSLIYHRALPEAAHDIRAGDDDIPAIDREQVHAHAHFQTQRFQPSGDVVGGRRWLLVNDDVRIGVVVPERAQDVLYANGSADEILFLHRGSGVLRSQFGRLRVREGDYVVVPRGTIYCLDLDDVSASRLLVLECAGMVDSPARYRAANGQLLEAAPYSERDIRGPDELEVADGPAEVWLKHRGRFTRYCLDHHPFDVVGWDGYVYPVALNIADFEPRTGRFHLPPPTHQVFEAPGLVVCNFLPRPLDWDPDALPLPYHHSNLDSDEVMYYVAGTYTARRGVGEGSITHHVGGVPHGPQPGAWEAARTSPRETDEVAVMVDTFRPLQRTTMARQVLDTSYPFSWHG